MKNIGNSKRSGKRSIVFENPPYIYSSGAVVGKKEGEGPFSKYYDVVIEDAMFGENSWEKAENEIQRKALEISLNKSDIEKDDIDYVISGDLQGQLTGSTFALQNENISYFGVYGACSTMGESISLASILVDGKYANKVIAMTSSHFASAEKQFRFPLDYGGQRPYSATWTVTGGAAIIISNKKSSMWSGKNIRITSITTGSIIDYGIKDSMNMGACMAPAAAQVIRQNLLDLNIKADNYDKIITGDLGMVGKEILIDILKKENIDISNNYMDCGIEIYYKKEQDVHCGGSGCGCCAVTLAGYIFDKLRKGKWKKVLFVPTGALLSTITYNEGESIPGIAHGVVFESE